MKESVALAKEADTKKDFSPTKSDKSIHRVRNEHERQLGSLRNVIDNVTREGGTPSIDSIATELSSGMPTAERASVLLALQQTHGNRYVQRVVAGIQAKLKVGQPGDVYEQEADRIAEQIVNSSLLIVRSQRQGTEEKIQKLAEEEEKKKREEEMPVMTKILSGDASQISNNLEERLSRTKGMGSSLPSENRAFMEERFGVDFSGVRIHADSEAAKMARELNAEAFTYRRGIYFREGKYSPGTLAGKRLLSHELTHVVQQQKSGQYEMLQQEKVASAPNLPYDPNYGPSADHCEVYQSSLAKRWLTYSYRNNAQCACLNTPDEPHNNCVRKCLQVKMRGHLAMESLKGRALPFTLPLEADPLCHDMWEQHVECYRECECNNGFINYPVFSIMCRAPFPCLFVGGSIAWFNSCL
jgi:hypothetical protein